jgi:hypothetical protein
MGWGAANNFESNALNIRTTKENKHHDYQDQNGHRQGSP